MRFDEFMEAALYGPHGFYSRGGGAGTQRDFLTSPEVGTLFGALVARRIDAEWDRLGQPAQFTVVEVGAGPGTLARTVFAAEPRCLSVLHYVLVDRAEGMRALHRDHLPEEKVTSASDIPTAPIVGVVIANELLDNIPTKIFHLAHDPIMWFEEGVWFDGGTHTRLRFIVEDGPNLRTEIPDGFPPKMNAYLYGSMPLQERAGQVARSLLSLVDKGALILIDYMRETTEEFSRLPRDEWMRTYRSHVKGSDPLQHPGECDITVDVALDQLIANTTVPTRVRTQAAALTAWGLAEQLAQSEQTWNNRKSDYDLIALRARSHASEAPILCDPAGLGGFTVVEWIK
jgi:SAM-dependent MidA family methyltransferase